MEVCGRDTGVGIHPANQARIFDKFVRLSGDGRRTPGSTGLGLAIVKKIMEDHNGYLLLDDREGGGAKVSLVFPPMERTAETDGSDDQGEEDPMKVATSLLAQGSRGA